MREERIVKYTREKLPEDDQTDWERLRSRSEEEIDDAARSDPDNLPLEGMQAKVFSKYPSGEPFFITVGIAPRFLDCFGRTLSILRSHCTYSRDHYHNSI